MVALKPSQECQNVQDRVGSRNAVVALKVDDPPPDPRPVHGSRNAVVALKEPLTSCAAPAGAEAGTPWWH